jgi:DNA-binding NtrC family response regulator
MQINSSTQKINNIPKHSNRILVVDDDKPSFIKVQKHLLRQGYDVTSAGNGEEALSQLAKQKLDLVISDLVLPDMNGVHLMKEAKKLYPKIHFIIYTARGSIESAVSAIRQGALDYLEKPFNEKTFDEVLQRTLELGRLTNENAQLQEHYRKRFSFHNIVTQSPAMQQTLDLAIRVAASPRTTISLTGESGSGKEVLARAIHFESGCLPASFVAVNCASIPESLLESELFGHVRGAFTGAEHEREGKFGLARGGTILLDEIGDMPLQLQAKLLRVLEERIYQKIGSNISIQAEFRIIGATHRNLAQMVKQGTFREDLYHRINVVPIAIPPLRERKEDIPILVESFLDLFRQHQGKSIPGISKKAMDIILSYTWPGNVRELRNVLEYATIMISDELIRPEHLRLPTTHSPYGTPDKASVDFQISLSSEEFSLDTVTQKVLDIALKRCGGNKSKAAALLKVNRKMFYKQ